MIVLYKFYVDNIAIYFSANICWWQRYIILSW